MELVVNVVGPSVLQNGVEVDRAGLPHSPHLGLRRCDSICILNEDVHMSLVDKFTDDGQCQAFCVTLLSRLSGRFPSMVNSIDETLLLRSLGKGRVLGLGAMRRRHLVFSFANGLNFDWHKILLC